ncbi:MAG: hypothetical protein JXC31_03365 [Acholeplasmataceae bacterium]|nr:hypothetical protein [Acholeplasmataceae bacterium]
MKIRKTIDIKKTLINIALVFAIIFGSILMTSCTKNPADSQDQDILDCVKRALANGTDTSVCYPENNPLGIVWIGNFQFSTEGIFDIAPNNLMKP